MRYECDTSDTSATRVLSHPSISYIANERLLGEEQFHSKNYFSEMSLSHAKMRLKSIPQKLNFVMAKAKSYTKNLRIVTQPRSP